MARDALRPLVAQLRETHEKIGQLDRHIHAWHRSNAASRRLETVFGIGPITASAIVATITDSSLFSSGRQLSAWLGLVPRQNSSGGKDRLGHIFGTHKDGTFGKDRTHPTLTARGRLITMCAAVRPEASVLPRALRCVVSLPLVLNGLRMRPVRRHRARVA